MAEITKLCSSHEFINAFNCENTTLRLITTTISCTVLIANLYGVNCLLRESIGKNMFARHVALD